MSKDEVAREIESGLESALRMMEDLQRRIDAGEELSEKEVTAISRMISTEIEMARQKLEEAVGPVDPDELREMMRKELSPEEYEEWLANEEARKAFREELQKERGLREQLDKPQQEAE